jgi:hypothetical protein
MRTHTINPSIHMAAMRMYTKFYSNILKESFKDNIKMDIKETGRENWTEHIGIRTWIYDGAVRKQ